MSKNMTRKGLAFGAGAALVVSGLAAMPAQAANESGVSLVPFYGPSDNFVTLQGDDYGIVLETEISNIGNNDPSKLKYLVSIIQDANVDNYADIDGGGINAYAMYASSLTDADGDDELTAAAQAATVANPNASATSRVVTPGNMAGTKTFGITSATILAGADINDADGTTNDIVLVIPGHDVKVGDEVTLGAGVITTAGPVDYAGSYGVTAVTANSITIEGSQNAAIVEAAGAGTVAAGGVVTNTTLDPSATEQNLLYLSVGDQDLAAAAGNEDLSLTVRAWVDQDGDNLIGANEYASPVRTVTFKAVEDVTVVHNVDFLTVGSTSIGGNFSISGINNLNWFTVAKDTIGDGFEVDVDKAGANTDTSDNTDGTAAADATLTYNALLDRYEYEFDANAIDVLIDGADNATNALDAGTYNFKLVVNDAGGDVEPGDADGAGVFFSGNKSDTNIAVVASTSSLNKMEIVASTSATVNQNSAAGGNSLIEEAETVELLTGTKSIPFTIDLYTAATTRAGSGIEVEVTIKDVTNNLDSTTLTVEGKTLSAITAGDQIAFTKKTDANGQISFTIAADEGADGESFTIDAKAGDKSIDTTTVQWADRNYKLVQTPDTNFTIDTLGNVTVEYSVVDQFNQVPSGDYQLAFTRARASGLRTDAKGTTANWSYVAPLSSTGRASVTIVDNGSATVEGVDTVTATLQKAATGGTGFVAEPNHTADTFTITYETDLDGIATSALVSNNGVAIGSTAVYPVELEAKSLKDVDTRFGDADPKYSDTNAFDNKTDTTADNLLRVYGTVTDTDNAGVSGVAVELSAAGLNFANANTSAGASLMLNDSIVVVTDANGLWQAWVRSAVSGKRTISVDAQGATGSVDVTFEGSTGTAAAMTLDVAASVLDGRTADVKATVVDAFGNPVEGVTVTFKEAGPGYLNTASGTTDAEGEVIVNLITVSGDTGSSTITASATLAGVSSSVSKTVTVGAAAASSDQKVNAGSFKGYVALYAKGYAGKRMSAKVGNDWVVVPVLASNFERVVEFTGAGYTVAVRIYIDRVLVDTITVTTK